MYLQAAAFLLLLIPQRGMGQFLEPDCGVPSVGPTISSRIMGGDTTQITSHPWMASLRVDSQHICGGTLINRRFVLTAAHCIADSNRIKVRLGGYGTATSVQSGKCLLLSEDFDVEFALISSQYNSVYQEYDFGLLKLNRRVEYKVHIKPICIAVHPSIDQLAENQESFTIVGWGKSEPGVRGSDLRSAIIRHNHRSVCEAEYGLAVPPSQICAGGLPNTCRGDSGGPLSAQVNFRGTSRVVQFGITSFGDTECMRPSVYTNVVYFREWIRTTVMHYSTQQF